MLRSLRSSLHLSGVLPITFFLFLFLLWPALRKHTLTVDSPMFAQKTDATAWANRTATDARCFQSSIGIHYHAQGISAGNADAGPWFVTLSCNQPKIYGRLGIILILTWAIVTGVAMIFFPPEKTQND